MVTAQRITTIFLNLSIIYNIEYFMEHQCFSDGSPYRTDEKLIEGKEGGQHRRVGLLMVEGDHWATCNQLLMGINRVGFEYQGMLPSLALTGSKATYVSISSFRAYFGCIWHHIEKKGPCAGDIICVLVSLEFFKKRTGMANMTEDEKKQRPIDRVQELAYVILGKEVGSKGDRKTYQLADHVNGLIAKLKRWGVAMMSVDLDAVISREYCFMLSCVII